MKKPPTVDLILASRGHFDHIEDLVACARESAAPVVGIFELCDWLSRKGIANTAPMNKGGSQDILGLRVTMTDARHSSGYFDNGQMVYMGEPAGYVVRRLGWPHRKAVAHRQKGDGRRIELADQPHVAEE